MSCKIINNSGMDMTTLTSMAKKFYPYAQEYLGFDKPATIVYESDPVNAQNPLGKTAQYQPSNYTVTLYVDGRHPKDLLRSLAHELVHHTQNCRGDLSPDKMGETGNGYAQTDQHLRKMEQEAYASMVMRDWEDQYKSKRRNNLNETIYSTKENTTMSEHEKLIKRIVAEVLKEAELIESQEDEEEVTTESEDEEGQVTTESEDEEGDVTTEGEDDTDAEVTTEDEEVEHGEVVNENGEQIFAPNHYCVHHGGVQHNGQIAMAEAVSHNYNEELGRVTHYDMKLADGTVLENVAAEDIQVTNASLAEGHGSMKRDDNKKPDKDPEKPHDDGDEHDERCDYIDCEEKNESLQETFQRRQVKLFERLTEWSKK